MEERDDGYEVLACDAGSSSSEEDEVDVDLLVAQSLEALMRDYHFVHSQQRAHADAVDRLLDHYERVLLRIENQILLQLIKQEEED